MIYAIFMGQHDPFAATRRRMELLDANDLCAVLCAAHMMPRTNMPDLPWPMLRLWKDGFVENYWTLGEIEDYVEANRT